MRLIIIMLILILSFSSFATDFRITTYNLGLAETFVPYARERVPVLIDELKRHQSDFLCLQEVWRQSDKVALSEQLKGQYPYSYYALPENIYSKNSPACNPWHLFGPSSVGICVLKNCLINGGDQFTQCVVENCAQELKVLTSNHQECAQGLMAAVGKSPIKSFFKLINPFDKAPLFAYDGDNGLLVLSKHPMLVSTMLDYSHYSTVNRRSSLIVELKINQQTVSIACSHLAAQLSDIIPYPGANKSWEGDNQLQVQALLKYMNDLPGAKVLAGDFNCSLADANTGVLAEFPANCSMITDAGYQDFVRSNLNSCTFCNSNRILSLEKKLEKEGGSQLDHIFTKNVEVKSATLEFNSPVMMQLDGKATLFHPSDHYGLQQVLDIPE